MGIEVEELRQAIPEMLWEYDDQTEILYDNLFDPMYEMFEHATNNRTTDIHADLESWAKFGKFMFFGFLGSILPVYPSGVPFDDVKSNQALEYISRYGESLIQFRRENKSWNDVDVSRKEEESQKLEAKNEEEETPTIDVVSLELNGQDEREEDATITEDEPSEPTVVQPPNNAINQEALDMSGAPNRRAQSAPAVARSHAIGANASNSNRSVSHSSRDQTSQSARKFNHPSIIFTRIFDENLISLDRNDFNRKWTTWCTGVFENHVPPEFFPGNVSRIERKGMHALTVSFRRVPSRKSLSQFVWKLRQAVKFRVFIFKKNYGNKKPLKPVTRSEATRHKTYRDMISTRKSRRANSHPHDMASKSADTSNPKRKLSFTTVTPQQFNGTTSIRRNATPEESHSNINFRLFQLENQIEMLCKVIMRNGIEWS